MLRGTAGLGSSFRGLSRSGAVIIDLGEAYTKCGFVGESRPRKIVATAFSFEEGHTVTTGVGNTKTVQDWRAVLFKFFKALYFTHLKVTPADRKVLLCENPFWPNVFKEAVAWALFDLSVPSVMFLPKAPLPLYMSMQESGLVVDVGYTETRVLPVAAGFPAQNMVQTGAIGMQTIHTAFIEGNKQLSNSEISLSRTELDDVVVRTCFVGGREEGDAKDLEVTTRAGEKLVVSGSSRTAACNTAFGDNEDEINVAALVLDAMLTITVDARASIVTNLVLCGGTSMLAGFRTRLLSEINTLIDGAKYVTKLGGLKGKFKICDTPVPGNTMHYVGAGIVGSMNLSEENFITKSFLEQGGEIPDWSTQTNVDEDNMAAEPEAGEGQYYF